MSGSSPRVNANVARSGGRLSCAHCQQQLEGTATDYLTRLPWYEGPVAEVGPHVFTDSQVYIDAPVVFRQFYCPGCYTALHTEVVPDNHAEWLAGSAGAINQ